MNTPAGFRLAHGRVVAVNPWAAITNPSTPDETMHVLLSAFAATGFGVAAVYAAGILRGWNDALHRRGLALALAMGALAAPLLGLTGDASARFVAVAQPAKLAAMEALFHTTDGAPLTIGGIPDPRTGQIHFGIPIPPALSLLITVDNPNARVTGLDAFPRRDWPAVLPVHLAFDTMVGTGFALLGLGLWFWLAFWRGKRVPTTRPLLLATLVAGPLAFIGMEAGWLVTEFGRQPWVVYGVLRTADAATTAPGVMVFFLIFLAIYLGLAVTSARLLLRLARRNRETDAPRPRVTPTLRAVAGRAR